MATFEEARRNEESWKVCGKLVNKRVYFTKSKDNEPLRLLSLTFIDSEGTLTDIQTWKTRKVYCLYRKLTVDESYEIIGRGPFETPNQEFSTSKYLFKKWWWVEQRDYLKLRKYVPCSINMDKMVNVTKSGRPDNILGVFMDYTMGPAMRNRRPNIQGYFVRLQDEEGKQFRVLIWHTAMQGNKFPLLQAETGDDILITCVRSSYLNPSGGDEERLYTVTSLCPPVVNSACVSNRRRQDLKKPTWAL